MIGLDTNVLVRYLVQDDPLQSKRATAQIEKAMHAQESLFLNHIVLCELVWVLMRAYRYPKSTVLDVLEKIMLTEQFEIESKDVVWSAINDYKIDKADFSDALIGVKNHLAGCRTTLTFDNAAGSLLSFSNIH